MSHAVARPVVPSSALTRTCRLYSEHVNPRWVDLLGVLEMQARYTQCRGVELQTDDGRTVLDFLSGYCVYNMGHNHPEILSELETEMHRLGPTMLQSDIPALAAELAEQLITLAGGRLRKVFFSSSGSEGIETAIKFTRAHTGRDGLLFCDGAFHGLTTGALSIMGNDWWRQGFGSLLPNTQAVPFGDLAALERELATKRYAAFFIEPVQAEAGILVPSSDYLPAVQALCRQYKTLLVVDEVQTGLWRTGPFLASQRWGLEPDMVVIAKALSGGFIPVGAVMMSEPIYRTVYGTLSRAFIHASTFSENALAMRAGLATLQVMQAQRLGHRAELMGEMLRSRLQARIGSYEMVREIRGVGLLCGIAFQAPQGLKLRLGWETFARIHSGAFGQLIVSSLFRRENLLTQMCGNQHSVLKVAPPLVVTEAQIDRFVEGVGGIIEEMHAGAGIWKHGLSLAQRALRHSI